MGPKKLVRSTNAQIRMLVDYMSQHKAFANGEFMGPLGAQRAAQEWEKLRVLLGEHGADKSVEQWKQTWRDIKRKARKEKAEANTTHIKTEDSVEVPLVSDTTLKVLYTIGQTDSVPSPAPRAPRRRPPARPPPPRRSTSSEQSSEHSRGHVAMEHDPLSVTTQAYQNKLLENLCDLLREHNSIMRERNRIERHKMRLTRK